MDLTQLAQLTFAWPTAWPAAVGAGFLALLAIHRFYATKITSRWRIILPTLRGLALAALAISLVQPVVIASASANNHGAILLLVDSTTSMGQHDGQDPAVLVGLADGLAMIPAGRRDSSLQTLHANVLQLRNLLDDLLRARSELDYARASSQRETTARNRLNTANERFRTTLREIVDHPIPSTRPSQPPEPLTPLFRLRTNSERITGGSQAITTLLRWTLEEQAYADRILYQSDETVTRACDILSKLSPWERIQLALVTPESGILSRLGADSELFGFSIADDAQPLPLQRDGQPVRKLLALPGAVEGDLSPGIQSAIAKTSTDSIDAIIVFSDGRPTGESPTLAPAVAATGAPLYVVCAAPPVPSSGQSIRQLSQTTGGTVLTLDQISTLPKLLAAHDRISRTHQSRLEIWDSPYLFALVLALLTTEWAIRKRIGLP